MAVGGIVSVLGEPLTDASLVGRMGVSDSVSGMMRDKVIYGGTCATSMRILLSLCSNISDVTQEAFRKSDRRWEEGFRDPTSSRYRNMCRFNSGVSNASSMLLGVDRLFFSSSGDILFLTSTNSTGELSEGVLACHGRSY